MVSWRVSSQTVTSRRLSGRPREELPLIAMGMFVPLSGAEMVPSRSSTPTCTSAGEGMGREAQA